MRSWIWRWLALGIEVPVGTDEEVMNSEHSAGDVDVGDDTARATNAVA